MFMAYDSITDFPTASTLFLTLFSIDRCIDSRARALQFDHMTGLF